MADLSNFKRGQIVGAPMAGASETKPAELSCSVSLFNGISTFAAYLMPKPSF